MEIDDLPNEILAKIFRFLTAESLLEIEKIKGHYGEVIEKNQIWKSVVKREYDSNRLWREVIDAKFSDWDLCQSYRQLAVEVTGEGTVRPDSYLSKTEIDRIRFRQI